jgi:hypothetical protein
MARDPWQRLAWLLVLSAAFWSAVAFYSCDAHSLRPADLAPPQGR